ncbi:MAG TPA: photosystem reaction center subunit H [Planctomycetaceae bacterium]|nr:photosystem reaction center subunit H [Planctomycetaceae bacterium]
MRTLTIFGLCAAISAASISVSAQNTVAPTPPTAQQTDTARQRLNPGAADRKTSATTIRASQLTGMNIVNSVGEDVGEVHDVVLDGKTGRVRYLAVTYGGFLGFGDKLFAVPYEAFRYQVSPEDADDHAFVLDITKQQMEGAQGFDQDNWPNFADKTFTSELDRRYRVERRDADGTRRGVDVRVNRNGVDVDVKRD